MKKKCPECGSISVRLYQNKSYNGKRKWTPIAWFCTNCNYTYKIVSDTLIYKMGEHDYIDSFYMNCPNCALKLVKVYRHKNPKYGKQQWISIGRFCRRCKYIWIDKKLDRTIVQTISN